MTKLIYIAGPYYHRHQSFIDNRMEAVYAHAAKLMREGHHSCSPMLMHEVVKRHDLPNNFEFWSDYSFNMLKRCDEMHILMLDGWSTSKGVLAEIKFCSQNMIPFEFIGVN